MSPPTLLLPPAGEGVCGLKESAATNDALLKSYKMNVRVKIQQHVVSLSVEPTHTVGYVLSQVLAMQNMQQLPDGQQRLFLGDALLENERTLADIGIEDGAELVVADVSDSLQGSVHVPQAETSPDGAAAASDLLAPSSHPSAVIVPQQSTGISGGDAAATVVDSPPPLSSPPAEDSAAAPPSSPFLMQKKNPATLHNIRSSPSLEANVLCVVAGSGIYEFERTSGDWALMSPSEFERLKATGQSFVAQDASVDMWCRIAADGDPLFERLSVDDMAATLTAHRSLLVLASSSSWPSPSLLPALHSLLDSDSSSVKLYACTAACSWCAEGVIAAKTLAVPFIHSVVRLLCDGFAPLAQRNVYSCAWALAEDLTFSHPGDAGDVLSELLMSSLVGDDDARVAAALDGLCASITTLQRRSTLIKAGLLPPLLERLKCRDNSAVFLSALSVCSRMCDRSNSSEVNPHQKEIVASGVLPLVVAAFDGPTDAQIQGAASQVLWYLTRDAQDELVAAGIPALKHRLLQQSSDVHVLTNVLTPLGNYFNANKAHADLFLQLGTLPVIVGLLSHDMPDIQATTM